MEPAYFSQEDIAAADPGTAFTSSQNPIEASIAILTQQLQHEWKHGRTPKGLEAAFVEALNLEETTTERIFLDHGGKTAWLAYFRATHHVQGEPAKKTALAPLHELSAQDRINAARRVGGSVPHATVADVINRISHRRRRK
jgi:hypothetical protein